MIGRTISHYLPEADPPLADKILKKLGQSGIGVVYNAEDTKLKRTIALKFLVSDITWDAIAAEQIIKEARAVSAFDNKISVTYKKSMRVRTVRLTSQCHIIMVKHTKD